MNLQALIAKVWSLSPRKRPVLKTYEKFLTVIFASFLAGCTSNIAMLQTDNPESDEYRFIFGKMLLDYDKVEKLSPESRVHNFETQLNFVLQQDLNTAGCSIVPGTINFGEPGSQGEALIH